jgi:hypothetical protein
MKVHGNLSIVIRADASGRTDGHRKAIRRLARLTSNGPEGKNALC